MCSQLEELDVLDLLSKRHMILRKKVERMWNAANKIKISNSEWYVISHTYKKQPTIATVTKQVDITRQATHKLIKGLEQKGIMEVHNALHNKKDKCITLTIFGESIYEEYTKIKNELESDICHHIGREQLQLLKSIISSDWGIED
ncbi:MarR family winged helix-turn-helix transcriptional regulator [Rummeliibacillus pycnus]|uniref:MarR family winged helix-turn-helix transcriptional regulator n=1 Tax=Rummeliibacillus pycnus TaxID=101070 RepID=UPI000C99F403|nr:MarR family winged helix-turn-helix transcriptional regulator [Rummeliibacillus pycnus]